jgi:hypothetical protein
MTGRVDLAFCSTVLLGRFARPFCLWPQPKPGEVWYEDPFVQLPIRFSSSKIELAAAAEKTMDAARADGTEKGACWKQRRLFVVLSRACLGKHPTEQNRTEQNRTEQNRTEHAILSCARWKQRFSNCYEWLEEEINRLRMIAAGRFIKHVLCFPQDG